MHPILQQSKPTALLFWDHGGLWSLMAWQALASRGLAVTPVTANEIRGGKLAEAGLLFVPGGWPSLKLSALGGEGAGAVRDFVAKGGHYVGLCGGAGLALAVNDGMGLVPLDRAPHLRPPSLSGPVRCEPGEAAAGHPMWAATDQSSVFHVWFPGQFAEPESSDIKVVARYLKPHPELCSADLVYREVAPEDWPGLEKSYGMRLNPGAIRGLPAVVEARVGQGRALLSYLHWDTPDDGAGGHVLRNLWRERLGLEPGEPLALAPNPEGPLGRQALGLWQRGMELGLWQQRHTAMPLWRRGARGLEFWSLYRLCLAADSLALITGAQNSLAGVLEPVWREGPPVLEAQAARLGKGSKQAEKAEEKWFGVKRRVRGSLALALAELEKTLLGMIKSLGGV